MEGGGNGVKGGMGWGGEGEEVMGSMGGMS